MITELILSNSLFCQPLIEGKNLTSFAPSFTLSLSFCLRLIVFHLLCTVYELFGQAFSSSPSAHSLSLSGRERETIFKLQISGDKSNSSGESCLSSPPPDNRTGWNANSSLLAKRRLFHRVYLELKLICKHLDVLVQSPWRRGTDCSTWRGMQTPHTEQQPGTQDLLVVGW